LQRVDQLISRNPRSVIVLHESIGADARADEADTLVQADYVADTLRGLGWSVASMSTDLDLKRMLANITDKNPECVFNLVESLNGDGRLVHIVPAVLGSAKIRFTGADGDAMYLSSQKLLAKRWMNLHGIATPLSFLPGDAKPAVDTPWIVKSVWEHASLGLDDGCVVDNLSAARARIDHSRAQHGGDWFAEQFVDGREFNVAVLEVDRKPYVLPIAEMTFVDFPNGKPKIVGYAAKWDETAPEYHATQRSFAALRTAEHSAIVDIVLQCWNAFSLRGYARIDLRMDVTGVPWVLEVNANPCLSPDAGFAAAVAEAGMTPAQAIEHIISAATI
jgi:D-alanine-D-alanine ligase